MNYLGTNQVITMNYCRSADFYNIRRKFFVLFVILLGLFPSIVFGQLHLKDSVIDIVHVYPVFTLDLPDGDMADRFGYSTSIGAGFQYKSNTNWFVGFESSYTFGDQVNETSMLDGLKTSEGMFINGDGTQNEMKFDQRGFRFFLKAGLLIPVLGPNPNSGIFIGAGLGFLQHKIKIGNPIYNVPQLSGDYLKGYDRLSNGLALSGSVGYMYLSNNRLANFFVGYEFVSAWTKSRRDFNFDTMRKDDSERLDILNGFRVGWIIPFYKRTKQEYYID